MRLGKAVSAAYRHAKQHMPCDRKDGETHETDSQPPLEVSGGFEGEDFSRSFVLGERLGKGARSTVFKATFIGKSPPSGAASAPAKSAEESKTGTPLSPFSTVVSSPSSSTKTNESARCYAVKRTAREGLNLRDEKCLFMEVNILRAFQHPNVVSVYQFYRDDPDYYYTVMEYVGGGALYDRIVKQDAYTEEQARDLCRALLNAVKYCHDQGVVHRDLKPANILLVSSSDGGDGGSSGNDGAGGGIKLCDFGLARKLSVRPLTHRCGTPYYMAPEMLLGLPYGTSVDMWSVGVVIYIMLAGYVPFYAEHDEGLYRKIKTGGFKFHDDYWGEISDEAKNLVAQLLTVDPTQRITAAGAIKHPWLSVPGRALSRNDLGNSLRQLRVFNAKQKLRAAVQSVVLAKQLLTSISEFQRVFDLGEELGRGTFATVFKATVKGWPDRPFAVKRTNRRCLDSKNETALLEEARIMRSLQHPNVVELHQFYQDDPDYYYMVQEYMAGGELFDRIVKKAAYSEEEARDLCLSILKGVKYCHSQGVVHRDLKPENLLLPSRSDDTSIKLADFGLALNAKEHAHSICSIAGTPEYLAPEMLKWVPYGTSVDMWSMGVVVYVILAGYLPFHDKDQTRLFRKIKAGLYAFHSEYWANISDDAKDLIRKMLTVDHTQRITATDAMRHPWFRAPGRTLSSYNLGSSLEQLQVFNAKRKLRAAVKSVSGLGALQEGGGGKGEKKERRAGKNGGKGAGAVADTLR